MKASAIGTASKASPAPLPSPSTIRKRSSSLALLYAVRKARPQSPSLSARDFPAAELRSLNARRADCCKVTPTSPFPPVVVRRASSAAVGKGAGFRRLLAYCFVSGLGRQALLMSSSSLMRPASSGVSTPSMALTSRARIRSRTIRSALGSAPLRSNAAPISLIERSTAATELICWAGAVVAAPGRTPPSCIARRARPYVAAVRLVGDSPAQPATVATRRSSTMLRAGWEMTEGR